MKKSLSKESESYLESASGHVLTEEDKREARENTFSFIKSVCKISRQSKNKSKSLSDRKLMRG